MTALVSVIVPTYRRPALLNRCLQALLSQNFPPEAYEVIVVDDGPEDSATREVVESWQARLQDSAQLITPPLLGNSSTPIPITGTRGTALVGLYLPVFRSVATAPQLAYLPAYHTQGPAAARNTGWRAAHGAWIAFTDDDCIPEPDWLMQGLAAFSDGVAGVSGRVIVPLPTEPTDHQRNTAGLERSDFVTANCFYRRDALEAAGGFDENFRAAWREDSDLFFTLKELGYTLAWARGAVVVHPVRPEAWGSSLRTQRKSFYNALLYKKHPLLYWRYIQPSPPWNYYLLLTAFVVGIAGLVLGSALAAVSGLGLWLALTAQLILRRLDGASRAPAHVAEMIFTSLVIPFLSIYWRLRGAMHWRVFFL
jgi:cellulose synthase/poly-beta-1,6-N-acetylglucosamine synthase-like glycosyltransferase